MDEIHQIKDELFSLYKIIKNDIPNEKLSTNRTKNIEDINLYDSITLINYIKESIPLLINQKISEAISSNSNNNEGSLVLEENNIHKEYLQLENQIRKLEFDNRYYLKNFLKFKLQKDVLEMKLNAYSSLVEEYEELKEKVKYDGNKFLDNDRKDNEINILRKENSSLKKEIVKLEKENKTKDNKIKESQKKIESLNKRIFTFEKIVKGNTFKTKSLSKEKNKSCVDLEFKINNDYNKIYTTSNCSNLKNIRTIYPQTLHFKKKNILNFYSPKNDIIKFENASTYNKINKFNYKNCSQIPVKNEFKALKKLKSNSITIIKVDENKSTSTNKYSREKNNLENILYKPNKKLKIFNRILNSKTKSISPLSFKNCKKNKQIIHKYIHREFNKNIINSNSQNIRVNSNIH